MTKTMERLAIVGFILGLGLAAGVAGNADYEEAKLQEQVYCRNVKDGTWPDYNGNYKEVCGGEEPPKFFRKQP